MPMDEVIPGLWIGDLLSAQNTAELKGKGIFSILSAMRGRIRINETFIRHQISLDDEEEADILVHFMPSITFIQAELDKGRGVLVHCQAGMSRSAAIVAAYLMYTKKLDPQGALDLIREARPLADPNEGFLIQLQVFYEASFNLTRKNQVARRFYMERTVEEVMNGDGSPPPTDMFAKFPHFASDSTPATPGPGPRRRIRCKMCRQELAAREHMLDHGQLGAPTPASQTPAQSRRPSQASRSGSATAVDGRPRRNLLSFGLGDSLAMSGMAAGPSTSAKEGTADGIGGDVSSTLIDSMSTSALDNSSEDENGDGNREESGQESGLERTSSTKSMEAAKRLGRRLSDAVLATSDVPSSAVYPGTTTESDMAETVIENGPGKEETEVPPTHVSPAELVAQLNSNPKLATLRSPPTSPTLASGSGSNPGPSSPPPPPPPSTIKSVLSPPILANPKCSGYFVEPMKWMEPILSSGSLAGKIVCPNSKCGAKLGNYDWAGVCCGCKEWVTPGFCISRSKVDEVVR